MWRLLATLLLGAIGSALLVAAFSLSTRFPANMGPFVVLAVTTPMVLRVFRLGASYRQVFASCAGVGIMMVATTYVWGFLNLTSPLQAPVPRQFWSIALLMALVLFGSALAARAAWRTSAATRSTFDQIATALLVGCAAYAVVSFALIPLNSFARRPDQLLLAASLSALDAFFFAALSAVLIVPVLLGVRRFLPRRIPMVIVGAALVPLPFFAGVFLSGGNYGVELVWGRLVTSPIWFTVGSMPCVVAAAVVGWSLALPRLGKASVARASE